MRIANINIPDNKQVWVSLTYIYGIGETTSKKILSALKIDKTRKVGTLSEAEQDAIRKYIQQNIKVEGELREIVFNNIKTLKEIGCYRGTRHKKRLPISARTRTNARTHKGRKPAIGANKKK
ncbi:MAG: 30S ribosomal protein S13 [Patescibacteria group bacterium]